METALLYRYNEKQLCFKLREKLTSAQTDVKFHGELNTTTGDWRHSVQMFSALYPVPGFRTALTRRRKRFQDSFIGVYGVGGRVEYASRSNAASYKIGVWGRNEIKLDKPDDCWARIDVESMYNPHRLQFEHVVNARINKIFLSLTSKQDLKCTIGWYGVAINNQSDITSKMFVEVQENNWSAQIDSDKRINLMYHL